MKTAASSKRPLVLIIVSTLLFIGSAFVLYRSVSPQLNSSVLWYMGVFGILFSIYALRYGILWWLGERRG